MAEYYSNLLDEPLAGRLNDVTASSTEAALANLLRATGIDVPASAVERSSPTVIDEQIAKSRLNRAGMIIAWYCNEFVIADGSGNALVTLAWNHERARLRPESFLTAPKTELAPKSKVSEDDVTYVVANVVYPANKFQIHSVSYPGAQGDFALLSGQGRSVARKYFDVIATKQTNDGSVVALTEAKGSGSPSTIESDIQVVRSWRDAEELRAKLLSRLGLAATARVLASVAYPGESLSRAAGTSELDFVVLVEDNEWAIWGPLGSSIDVITATRGSSNLPLRYKY
jgi:hypothetical protein